VDFLEKLLCVDPEKRIDVYEALKNSFFEVSPLPCTKEE